MSEKHISFNIWALLLAGYTSIVSTIYAFLNLFDGALYLILFFLGCLAGLYFVFFFLFKLFGKIKFCTKPVTSLRGKVFTFVGATLACLVIVILWYIAYKPGSFYADSIVQYSQACSGEYGDWHPALHTLLFFTLPIKIFGNVEGIMLFQVIYFSLIIGYMFESIAEFVGVKQAVLAFLYIMLNPYVCQIMTYPYKDVAFAMAGLLALIMIFRLYYTNGRWGNSAYKVILLGVVIIAATIFRHNAVLFTAPLAIGGLLLLKKKQKINLIISMFVTFVIIKCVVYNIVGVSKPGNRVSELVGVPLTVMGNVAKETPEKMDDELSAYVYSIAPQNEWEEYYECGNFNAFKFTELGDLSIVDEKGAFYALKMMGKCFAASPKASFEALFSLTDIVYGFNTGSEGSVRYSIFPNTLGIKYSGNSDLKIFFTTYCNLMSGSVFKYLRTYGVLILLMLFVVFARLDLKNKETLYNLLPVIPVFIYDFGTMILLTGPDSRFFFVTILVAPIVIIWAMYKRQSVEK